MLLGGEGRDTYQDGEDQCEVSDGGMEIFAIPNAYPAEPADQTVDGGEEVVRGVYHIDECDCGSPESVRIGLRPGHGGGHCKEEGQTDESGQGIRREKPVAPESSRTLHGVRYADKPLLGCAEGRDEVIHQPEKITQHVYHHGGRQEGNIVVQRKRHVHVGPAGGDKSAAVVGQRVQYEGNCQGHYYICREKLFLHGIKYTTLDPSFKAMICKICCYIV